MRHHAARPALAVVCLLALARVASAGSAPARQGESKGLTVVSAGPHGEMAQLDQANEIRIVFSEPMVVLGKIPQPVRVPFVRIRPAIAGEFRWSGTTVLIFTPAQPPPYATHYEVTVDTSAAAISGRQLARPYQFRFTTPTVKLVATHWYRKGDRAGAAVVVGLVFNQPLRQADVRPHVTFAFEPHPFGQPTLMEDAHARLKRLDPASLQRFEAKIAAASAAASSSAPVSAIPVSTWDQKKIPPALGLIVFETQALPSDAWLRVSVGPRVPSPAGPATPGKEQKFIAQLEPTFFIDGFQCVASCDPDHWNPARFRAEVTAEAWRKAVTVIDITDPKSERPVARSDKLPRHIGLDSLPRMTLEDAGFERQPSARKYLVRVSGSLEAADGQTLGHDWVGIVENWHQRAFTSFGDGHGVWESSGGPLLPFYSRNFRNVTQWAVPLATSDLMPKVLELQAKHFRATPDGPGERRTLPVTADAVQSHGLDLKPSVGPRGTGLVWAGVREGDTIPRAKLYTPNRERSTIVQVTNLGINVKDSPENTLVFVTRLDTGAPVPAASVSIIKPDNSTFWKGTTGADGTVVAPKTPLRDAREWWEFSFLVLAEKDGDVAYTGSDWHEGITPWDFGHRFSLHEAGDLLRGTVFTDRGVYKLGEEVHFKAILRGDTTRGIRMLPAGTPIYVSVRDSQDKEVDSRTIKMTGWSSAEWTMTLPSQGALGDYSIVANLREPKEPADEDERNRMRWDPAADLERVHGRFLVAAYRRPDFRVDATLGPASPIAGATLDGVVTARYLFGAPMGGRPVAWKFSRVSVGTVTAQIRDRYPDDRFAFLECCTHRYEPDPVVEHEGKLNDRGEVVVTLDTPKNTGRPYRYTVDADVEDVSRQHIANRASVIVHPAPWYIGLKRPDYFVDQRRGLETAVVAVTPGGEAALDVAVKVTLTQMQWHSVRRAEGNGFYTWETTQHEEKAGEWTVTTRSEPVPLSIPVPTGGYFILRATASDPEGRQTTTAIGFYSLGDGYTAWQRFDHNRIELVADRPRYKPGETARIMIQSPWEQATALVTTEREGIRSHRQFALTSTQQSIEVPIKADDIPNVFVSVLLVKGRSENGKKESQNSESRIQNSEYRIQNPEEGAPDPSDPGKPSFRLGYVELSVVDASKRLTVNLKSNREEYRPAGIAKVDVAVADHEGKPASSEVTLWAVDYGVLSLTGFETPDVLASVYVPKALQVLNTDNRQRIISRRVLTPKGTDEGGGGGLNTSASSVRKDFSVLAFWLGSVVTDANGRASIDVKLPESLTTYRIMAVGGDKASRFGSGESEIRINKPVLLRPTFPRFLAVGDRVHFGSVVTSQLAEPGTATVTIRSLDPDILEFHGASRQDVQVGAKGQSEIRFDAVAKAVGRARVSMSVRLNSESDAFEDAIPVEILSSKETVAAYGEATTAVATEKLTVPEGVVPGVGGLHVELSSTAMVGLGEGARYLVEYPFGCAEQRSSRTLALVLAADLGQAFALPGIDGTQLRPRAQTSIRELETFQCPSGAFAYWPGFCDGNLAYLTSYVLHVMQSARALKYDVDKDVISRAAAYLEEALDQPPPTNEAWMPSFTAWEAFALKVLADVGRPRDSHVTRLYSHRDRMPVFGLAHLYDAMASQNQADPRLEDLRRRMANAILPEGGSAHVEELEDPYLVWFWSSNVRTTAIVLDSLVRHGGPEGADLTLIRGIVRWMMNAREEGRWGNTQENAWAMQGLVNYYRRFESEVPDFTAVVRFGESELASETFKGRSATAVTHDLGMPELVAKAAPGETRPLTFSKDGIGTLFYVARLQYASDRVFHDSLDQGFRISRRYSPIVDVDKKQEAPPSTSFKAGDLIQVTLTLDLPKERRWVAVVDPIPAGFEPVESWFQTTAQDLSKRQSAEDEGSARPWRDWWDRGGFDHVERHDDRVQLFATRLGEGQHEFTYIVRATTAGTFKTAPAHVEEMYEPEVFGRTGTVIVEVRR